LGKKKRLGCNGQLSQEKADGNKRNDKTTNGGAKGNFPKMCEPLRKGEEPLRKEMYGQSH